MLDDDLIPAEPVPEPKRRHPLRNTFVVLGALVVVVLLALVGGAWWIDTASGHAWLLRQAAASKVVSIGKLEGSLYSQLNVADVVVDTPEVHVTIDQASLRWKPLELLERRIGIDALDVGSVHVTTKPQPPNKPTSPPPTSLRLPIAIRANDLQLARLDIVGTPLVFTALQASLQSDGETHKLTIKQLLTPRGRFEADLQLDGDAPFKSVGQLQFRGVLDGKAMQAGVQLDGALRDLNVQARLQSEVAQASASLRADVFAEYSYAMLKQARISAERVNPQQLLATLPQASLSANITLTPRDKDHADGDVQISNAAAATWDQEAVPVTQISSHFVVSNNRLDLTNLQALLLGGGVLSGDGQFAQDRLDAKFKLKDLNVAALIKNQPPTKLSGDIALKGPYKAPDVLARLSDQRYKTNAEADLGWIRPETERRLAIRKLNVQRGRATVALTGEFALDGKQDFKAKGKLGNFNPAEYVSAPVGNISGDFTAEGALQPHWQGKLQYTLAQSSFNGQSLAGQGVAQLDATRLVTPGLWLQLGANRVDAKGALGKAADRLQLHIAANRLADIGAGFAGEVMGDVALQGGFKRPEIQGQLQAHNLHTPYGVQVASAKVDARLFPDLNSPIHADIQLADAQGFNANIKALHFNLQGTRGAHKLALQVNGQYQAQPLNASLAAAGGLDEQWRWSGRVDELQAQSLLNIKLLAPTNLTAGADVVGLGDTRIAVGAGLIHIARLKMTGAQLDTAGEISQVPVAEYLALAGIKTISSDMILSGRWQLHGSDTLDGTLDVQRDSGDLKLVGGTPQPFYLTALALHAQAQQSRVALNGQIVSDRFGTVKIDGNTQIDWRDKAISPSAPLVVNAAGNVEKLDKIAPLISNTLQLAGNLAFDVHRTGTLDRPVVSGAINGNKLAIRDSASGLALTDGAVQMVMQDNRVTLKQFLFHGGNGTLMADGTLDIGKEGPNAKANVVADKLTLINKPDMQMIVSGKGLLGYDKDGISIKGNMRADHGMVRYQASGEPHLSDDVVIAGAQKETKSNVALTALQFDVDLGDDFTFKGYGIDAKLIGALRLRASPNQSLSGHGTVSVESGKYAAYGQNLTIERGILSFAGPLDNPGLDILAMRRGGSVEVGVAVKGTANAPRVSLYSETALSDNEKLSWLLFGHGTDSMDKGDAAVMVQAINGLLAGNGGGDGIGQQVLGEIGIDEIGVSTDKHADGTTSQVVSVGKRLTDKVSIAFEKSLDGLEDAIKLTLRLSRKWSLITRFGAYESTLDASYNINFDTLPW